MKSRGFYRELIVQLLLVAAMAMVWQQPGRADDFRASTARMPSVYQQECAACHLAYPPAMLPASSWGRIMSGLERHFGSDASLDEKTVMVIGRWLEGQASQAGHQRVRQTQKPPEDRITRTEWFERKHRHIEKAVWRLSSVKSAARCEACHTRADRGDFDDDHLRMPQGLSARQRRAWNDD